MTIHLLALPHTETTRAWEHCAFTARTRAWASMMTREGHDVVLYGGEANEAQVAEHVVVATRKDRRRWWPWYDGSQVFNDFDPAGEGWTEFNARCIAVIRERMAPRDILAVTMGLAQKSVAEALGPSILPVEVGIGYSGVWAPHRVFESAAWRHYLAAREPTDDVRLYDAVIPRAWEIDDFPLGSGGGGYYLFMGRLMGRKGPQIAAEACQRIGAKLLVAGQGAREVSEGRIVCDDGTALEGDVHYLGVVGPQRRAELMGGAIATFAPTMYLEPGGGVAIESQLCGTSAITTDYGCFTESVEQGVTGYRCATLAEFAQAALDAPSLDRAAVRERAVTRYSTEAVGPRVTAYFARLATLWGDGWYAAAA